MGSIKHSKETEIQLVEEYRQGSSVQSLMTKYGYASKKSIMDKIKKHYPNEYQNIIEEAKRNRKDFEYNLKIIKNHFDAYFIGLLMTDGYISREREVGIELTDEDCIQFLSKSIGKEYKTYEPSSGNPEIVAKQMRHRLIIADRALVNDVSRFGIVPRKTETLQPPILNLEEEKFIPYIIRGIVDGDGCIFTTSYGAPGFYILTKSKDFADWLSKILTEKLFMNNIHVRITQDGLYRIETAEQANILKLIALVYDKPFGMSRKYLKLRKTFRDYNSDFLQDSQEEGIAQTTTN